MTEAGLRPQCQCQCQCQRPARRAGLAWAVSLALGLHAALLWPATHAAPPREWRPMRPALWWVARPAAVDDPAPAERQTPTSPTPAPALAPAADTAAAAPEAGPDEPARADAAAPPLMSAAEAPPSDRSAGPAPAEAEAPDLSALLARYHAAAELTRAPRLRQPVDLVLRWRGAPEDARGQVRLLLLLAADGQPDEVLIEAATLPPALVSQVVAHALATRYEPGEIDGRAVPARVAVDVAP